jgi:TonB family protein
MARNLRVEGIAVVSVLVDENGQVQEARMAEPIKQNVGLNEAAMSSARSARYKPATKDGVRVKMWTRLRIPFKL